MRRNSRRPKPSSPNPKGLLRAPSGVTPQALIPRNGAATAEDRSIAWRLQGQWRWADAALKDTINNRRRQGTWRRWERVAKEAGAPEVSLVACRLAPNFSMAAAAKGGGGGQEEEEEHHRNPFLSAIGSKPASSKLQFRKEASGARWIEDIGMGEVVEKKGSMWTTTGITRNGKLYCHIEEISFLAERGALLLSDFDETAFSMKDVYKKIASQMAGCSWEAFEVYRHLKSLGYIVGRHGTPWTMKSSISCCSSDSLHDTLECNGRSDNKPEEEITTMLKDLQIREMKPAFDVYLPNSNFRKSSPGDPTFVLCVLRESPPSRVEVEKLQRKCNGIPLKFCFVDHGRVTFFSFDKVVLPTLP